MRPNAITVFLGLAILEVAGCHPILVGTFILFLCLNVLQTEKRNTNAILNGDGALAIVSDAFSDNILTAAGPLGIAVRVGSSVRKRSAPLPDANKRGRNLE
ncbi:uncharacterized protein EAF02_007679 [Botrytis sinoallii]|uniref:uncharacterized protein n=1 Tax=Botrytis sinoallii TaxID=1463999 RepID=UPI0018FFFC57|nr:uncharacterized protein EAF02_007679 [Botrytis sinoallii]KAF7880042.1 hypothetical protein EAF02_007679 [Botrytis sinoallii]